MQTAHVTHQDYYQDYWIHIPYSGKFHEVQMFTIFATHDQKREKKNYEITMKIWTHELLREHWTCGNFHTYVLWATVSLDLTTALHRYFKLADNVLLSLMGDLSSSVSPATIKECGQQLTLVLNAKIKSAKISSGVEMGFSQKFGPAKISRYTVYLITTYHFSAVRNQHAS